MQREKRDGRVGISHRLAFDQIATVIFQRPFDLEARRNFHDATVVRSTRERAVGKSDKRRDFLFAERDFTARLEHGK